MRDKIIYEWSLHEFDGNGDIHHTEYGDSLGDFWADDIRQAITERGDRRLELRRYVGNDDEGDRRQKLITLRHVTTTTAAKTLRKESGNKSDGSKISRPIGHVLHDFSRLLL